MDTILKTLSDHDPILANIIATVPLPLIKSTHDVFFDLMSCILEQQIHYRSTKRIFQKMLDKAELTTLNVDNFHILEEKAFGTIKLSTSKLETIERTLAYFREHTIHWQALNDAEVAEKLSNIKGVGKWTVDMILLYTLERADVFPHDDFHVKEIMTKLYGLNPKSKLKVQMIDLADAWGDHKSWAVKYLLAWKQHNKTLD